MGALNKIPTEEAFERAIIALIDLAANQQQDAINTFKLTDSEGNELQGGKRYTIHFERNGMPPAGAFWSLIMYDPDLPVPNPINRYAIGDRDALGYNRDGSLDIYVQPDSPGAAKESNWLPSPTKGVMNVTMHIHTSEFRTHDRSWMPPAVTSAV